MIAAGACIAAACGVLAAEPLRVTAVRHWSLGDATRIVVEVSGEFSYHWGRLSKPERVYFDILGARPDVGRGRVVTFPVGDTLVRQIRVSETQPSVTRVVLDLEVPVEHTAARLANPERLIVEVRAKGKPAAPRQASMAAPPPGDASPAGGGAVLAPAAPAKPATPAPAEEPPAAKPAAAPAAQQEALIAVPARKGSGSQSLVRALGLKLGRVVIDPGHGGHDTGTIGPGGLAEKDLALDIALRLGALIEEKLGAEVFYTRTTDVFVPLEERTALANEKKADLFLSIHANAGASTAAGAETYYLNFTTSKSAMEVAARENASSERSIHELQSLIEKIVLKDKVEESREFASRIQSALHKEALRRNPKARNRGVRKAPFVVLIGASMPSVLAEIGFLSNPREERLLKRSDHRNRLAAALLEGVSQYASTLSQFRLAEGAGR